MPVRIDECVTLAVVCSLTACTLIVVVALAGLMSKSPANDRLRSAATIERVA
jgi:hypothetical protein